ncbi:hypothetical protein J6590_074795 [Homalodisca vitripennis]|nr:hypothetical protein J6590_074795 [Homalodisca vitripennis]
MHLPFMVEIGKCLHCAPAAGQGHNTPLRIDRLHSKPCLVTWDTIASPTTLTASPTTLTASPTTLTNPDFTDNPDCLPTTLTASPTTLTAYRQP